MNLPPRFGDTPPRFSVSLCSYNGGSYLAAQLHSLAGQTRLPDELVISDDGSTDNTADLVAEFARRAPFPVHFHRQPVNLGVTQNFAAALALCTGDLIALCDQDDVWLPDKIAVTVEFFARHPRCLAVFSDATLVDEALGPLVPDASLWRHVGVTPHARRQLRHSVQGVDILARRYLITGATLAVRRELLRRVLPIPLDLPEKMIHDAWIALVAAALGGLDSLPHPTLLYRQHGRQQVGLRAGPVPPSTMQIFTARRSEYRRVADRLNHIRTLLADRLVSEEASPALLALARRAEFFRRRAELPGKRGKRLWPIVCDLAHGNYHRFCRRPLLAALRDLAL